MQQFNALNKLDCHKIAFKKHSEICILSESNYLSIQFEYLSNADPYAIEIIQEIASKIIFLNVHSTYLSIIRANIKFIDSHMTDNFMKI